MTRIGAVRVKVAAVESIAPTFIQEITEDGVNRRATFVFERCLVKGGPDLSPGAINRVTHVRYRRCRSFAT